MHIFIWKYIKNTTLYCILLYTSLNSFAQDQDKGYITGTLMLNANFYQRDTIRGTLGPVYDNYLSGADAWLNVNYNRGDFRAGIRIDAYQNSILFNPTGSYSGQGLAIFYVEKQISKLNLTGGYFYDQFGSGITFRAYEARGIGIDNAIMGIRLKYELNNNWMIKAFTGRQKFRFDLFEPIIKGAAIDGFVKVNEDIQLLPGVSIVNRTLDNSTLNNIVSEINSYDVEDRFIPTYNVYTYSAYNNLLYKNISWYLEYARKSSDAVRDINNTGQLFKTPGSVLYTTLSYSKKGFGTTLQYRRIDQFDFRTSPNETLLNGIINYLPTFSRQNTYRLISRYNAIPQFEGENAFQGDVIFTPQKGYTFNISYANIQKPDGELLYQESYMDAKLRPGKKLTTIIGIQHTLFNKLVYQGKGDIVETITPFSEFSYKLTTRKSIRMELQYQYSRKYLSEDFGDWVYGLVEFNVAPKYSFAVSDMFNIDPWRDEWAKDWEKMTSAEKDALKDTYRLHFPTISASFTQKATKFTISYAKQVEGVVCTGGICRFQPAFSGVMASLLTSF